MRIYGSLSGFRVPYPGSFRAGGEFSQEGDFVTAVQIGEEVNVAVGLFMVNLK